MLKRYLGLSGSGSDSVHMCRRLDLQLLLMREMEILLENIFFGTKRANISLKVLMGQKEQIFIWVTPLKIFWYKKRKYIFVVQKEEIHIWYKKRKYVFGSPAENPWQLLARLCVHLVKTLLLPRVLLGNIANSVDK